jgi:AraC-like DNA-binding protein
MFTPRDPVREWREQFARRYLNLDFTPLSGAPFRAVVEPIFDDLRIARVSLSPGLTFRDAELVKDGDDALSLVILESGRLQVAQLGRDLRLSRGEATLVNLAALGTVGSHRPFTHIPVPIPRAELAARIAHPEDAVMRRAPQHAEALRLLRCYLGALARKRLGAAVEMREIMRRHIIDLVALTVTPHGSIGESGASGVVAARLATALEHVAARFQEPDLSLAAVARDQGISPRYLQRLFEMSGTSFTAHVNELRLQRAFALLAKPDRCGSLISDIALQVGFSDISHFNRLFRTRFGETPSATRAQFRPIGHRPA